ncbi:MAG: outer membrane lipoprotein LolB [Cocleimonas sp.]|jgi:outer membrane lipoprotein LolB
MTFKGLFAGLLVTNVLLITGCSQINTSPPSSVIPGKPPVTQQTAWQQRQAFLVRKASWQLKSKVSLRYDDENLIFGLNWLQRPPNNYVIQISNPITGALVSKLSSANGVVSLLADNGKTYRDNDEERLLKSQSGLNIPLKGMQHWVRGLTSPQYKVDKLVLDNAGRPRALQQAGWKVTYSSYVNNGTNALPSKINLSHGAEKIYIRLIAKNWQ